MLYLLLIPLVLSVEVKSPEQRLEELRKKLAQQKEKINELKGEKTGILKNIQELDKEITLNRELVQELKRKRQITKEEIKNIELLMEEIHYRLREKREILRKRIKEIYIHGPLHPVAVVLLSYSFSDALKRMKYLTIIANQDKKVVNEVLELEKRLKLKKDQVENKLAMLDKIFREVEKQEGELRKTREEKQEYLSEVENKRKKALKMSEEMKQAMEDLEQLITTLSREEETEASKYFEQKKLRLPVDGYIIGYFGRRREEKYGTVTMNRGIDIQADWGTDVKAVAPGRVVYSDNFLGYGKIILVEHGKGYISMYSHLASTLVESGDRVGVGQIIAKVGQTGSAREPLLHFEIRKSGKAVNPMNYIQL